MTGFLDAPLAGLPEAATWAAGLYVMAALVTAHLIPLLTMVAAWPRRRDVVRFF